MRGVSESRRPDTSLHQSCLLGRVTTDYLPTPALSVTALQPSHDPDPYLRSDGPHDLSLAPAGFSFHAKYGAKSERVFLPTKTGEVGQPQRL